MLAYVCNYAVAFLMAITIEPAIAWLLGYRRWRELACVVAVNVFSHPAANFLVATIVRWRDRPFSFGETLLLEAGVVLVESAPHVLRVARAFPERAFLPVARDERRFVRGGILHSVAITLRQTPSVVSMPPVAQKKAEG